jgi:hypothetical protein
LSLETIWAFRALSKAARDSLPRPPEVCLAAAHAAAEYSWEPVTEYLVTNPIDIYGLSQLLKVQHDKTPGLQESSSMNINENAFEEADKSYSIPTIQSHDDFLSLPVLYLVLSHLGFRDIANLRAASRSCRELPIKIFHQLLLEDMPWIWELRDVDVKSHTWYLLYKKLVERYENLFR